MGAQLDQLQNTESILLMYLADELAPSERAEVDRRLAENEKLRGELELLRQAQGIIWAGLSELDRQSHPPVPENVAIRRANLMIHEWVRQSEQIPQPIPMPRRQLPWIRLGMAAAAILLVGFILWPRMVLRMPGENESRTETVTPDVTVADLSHDPVSHDDDLAALNDSFGANSALSDESSNLRVAAVTAPDQVMDFPIGNR